MKVLFDTNVVLDHLLAREPHVEAAERLLSLVDAGRIEGVLCASTVTTLHYLAGKAVGPEAAARHLRSLLEMFRIAPVNGEVLQQALRLPFGDYEDAVLHEAARHEGVHAIVTRNGKGLRFSEEALRPIFSPQELLAAVLDGS